MLPVDDGEFGTCEFGEVDGADRPVTAGGSPVVADFQATITW